MHLLNTLPQRLDPGATPTFAGLIAPSLTSPASTPLTLGTGTSGAAITVLSADNNVGIGTVSPSAKLQTQSNYATSANDSDDADATILIENIHASGDAVLRMRGASGVSSVVYGKNGGTDRLNFIPRNDNGQRIAFNQNGVVSISNTTAGSSNAGALVVAGGISAGNTGSAASFFGGAVNAGPVPVDTYALKAIGNTTSNRSYGLNIDAGTTTADYSLRIRTATGGNADLFAVRGDGLVTVGNVSSPTATITSAGAATFAGAVAIGNTTAASVAAPSTHKVSILIGGVQYYLLASNV